MGSLMAGWDTDKQGHKEDMPEWLKEVRASGDGLVSPKARRSLTMLERQSSLEASSPRSPRARGSFKNDSAEGEATDPVLHAALVKCRSKVSGRPILGRTSAPTSIDTNRISVDSADAHSASEDVFSPLAHVEKVAWWKHMDSGKLNEARTDVPADYRMGSYMPQKQVARVHIHPHNEQTAA